MPAYVKTPHQTTRRYPPDIIADLATCELYAEGAFLIAYEVSGDPYRRHIYHMAHLTAHHICDTGQCNRFQRDFVEHWLRRLTFH